MSDFIIAPSASRDLNQIAKYFLSRNFDTREKLFKEFDKKCKYLVNFPNMGRYIYRKQLYLDSYKNILLLIICDFSCHLPVFFCSELI